MSSIDYTLNKISEAEAISKSIQLIIQSTENLSIVVLSQKNNFDLQRLQGLLLKRNESSDLSKGQYYHTTMVQLISKYTDFVNFANQQDPDIEWLKSLYIIVLQECINYQINMQEKLQAVLFHSN